jgi:hypothetical protein
MAIGRAAHDDFGGDHRSSAGTVVDDHGLPPGLDQLLRDQARNEVRATAGREGHDQSQWAAGIRARLCSVSETRGHRQSDEH